MLLVISNISYLSFLQPSKYTHIIS
jgi:hypothetical protein